MASVSSPMDMLDFQELGEAFNVSWTWEKGSRLFTIKYSVMPRAQTRDVQRVPPGQGQCKKKIIYSMYVYICNWPRSRVSGVGGGRANKAARHLRSGE